MITTTTPTLTPEERQYLVDHRVCMAPECLNHTSVVLVVKGERRAYCEACAHGKPR